MADPFLGEVRQWAISFVPLNWTLCEGQLMQINQNSALFSVIGHTYGGQGTNAMGIPDLRARAPRHFGHAPGTPSIPLGSTGGLAEVKLQPDEIPYHTHELTGDDRVADNGAPNDLSMAGLFAEGGWAYTDYFQADVTMKSTMLESVGGDLAHENRQPLLVVKFCLALDGTYPSRN